jgi:hypothetical protein
VEGARIHHLEELVVVAIIDVDTDNDGARGVERLLHDRGDIVGVVDHKARRTECLGVFDVVDSWSLPFAQGGMAIGNPSIPHRSPVFPDRLILLLKSTPFDGLRSAPHSTAHVHLRKTLVAASATIPFRR